MPVSLSVYAKSLPVVDDEPGLPPPEVEIELEGEGEGDVVDLAHLEHHDVHVDVQWLPRSRWNQVLFVVFALTELGERQGCELERYFA